jgi:hypothetical protein
MRENNEDDLNKRSKMKKTSKKIKNEDDLNKTTTTTKIPKKHKKTTSTKNQN